MLALQHDCPKKRISGFQCTAGLDGSRVDLKNCKVIPLALGTAPESKHGPQRSAMVRCIPRYQQSTPKKISNGGHSSSLSLPLSLSLSLSLSLHRLQASSSYCILFLGIHTRKITCIYIYSHHIHMHMKIHIHIHIHIHIPIHIHTYIYIYIHHV